MDIIIIGYYSAYPVPAVNRLMARPLIRYVATAAVGSCLNKRATPPAQLDPTGLPFSAKLSSLPR